MRNDIFNIQRYWKYQKHVVVQSWIPLAITYGIWGLFCLACAIMGESFEGPAFAMVLIAMVSVCAGWWPSFSKKWHIKELLIPASNLEKYISRLTVFFIFPITLAMVFVKICSCETELPVWQTLLMFSMYWILTILLNKLTFAFMGLWGFLFNWLGQLHEVLGNYSDLVVIMVMIGGIVGGYFCMRSINVTLTDWSQK